MTTPLKIARPRQIADANTTTVDPAFPLVTAKPNRQARMPRVTQFAIDHRSRFRKEEGSVQTI